MAMVFDIPRLTFQTALKLLLHVDISIAEACMNDTVKAYFLKKEVRDRFGNPHLTKFMNEMHMDYYDILDMNYDKSRTRLMEADADEGETYHRYQLSELAKIYARTGYDKTLESVSSFGRAFVDLITLLTNTKYTKHKKVWTDWDAAARVLDYLMSPETRAELTSAQATLLTSVNTLAREQTMIALGACKMGGLTIGTFLNEFISPGLRHHRWTHYKAIYKGIETLRMSSMTPKIRETFNLIREGGSLTFADDLKIDNHFMEQNFGMHDVYGEEGVYRWLGHYVFVTEKDICVLDIANLEQIQIVIKQWEGAYLYAMHYRAFGDTTKDDYLTPLTKVERWMWSNFRDCGFNDAFCRVMKMGLAILQNSFHSESEKFETGWEEKDEDLRKMQDDTLKLPIQFQDFLMSLDVKDRTRLDLANAHYFNICPDGDPHCLFKKVDEDMANPNSGNPVRFKEFMQYATSLFLCKTVLKYKTDVLPYIECAEDYDVQSKIWFKDLLEGRQDWKMPPVREWGKAKVVGFYSYTDIVSGWYYEADDVSHIISDYEVYSTYENKAKLTREDTNELLYAIKYAPYLSYKWDPSTLIQHLAQGTDAWDRLSDLSVKAEANKPSYKARDIHAADDVTRILTSAVDKQAVHISRLLPGVVSRKDLRASAKIFDEISELTREDRNQLIWVVSSDVSSWSPKAPRELWAQFNDLIMDSTSAPKGLRVRKIWGGIRNILSKRGYLRSSDRSKGMYQGWTGTGDSVMHNALLGYIVNSAKRKGILNPKATASTATLIDDAVQIIVFKKEDIIAPSDQERAEKLSKICKDYSIQIKEGYNDAGGVIDLAKTIMSSIKAIFLNQFVCEGSKVMTPMKVFAKCDRELSRRSATIFDHTDTILGSYRAAVEKGAEPITTYALALERCNELMAMTTIRSTSSVSTSSHQAPHQQIINASFAPRYYGGWGYPHIVGWLTKESPDPLTAYISLMVVAEDMLIKACNGYVTGVVRSLRSAFYYTINQETCEPSLSGFIKDPTRVCVLGVVDPRSAVIARVRTQLASKAESPIFRELLDRSDDTNVSESLDSFLLSGTFSADSLSLLADCLPEHCASGLTDKALMNDMVQVLFPYRVRSQISRTVRVRNKQAITRLLGIPDSNEYHESSIPRNAIYTTAISLREKWYASLGYRITNHTKQDYATSFTHHLPGQPYSVEVSFEPLISPCQKEGVSYANLYDGYVAAAKRQMPFAKNVFQFNKDFEKSGDPVRVCLDKAAVFAIYLTSQGKDGAQLWELVKAAWGASGLNVFPTVEYKLDDLASLKRISSVSAVISHPIACYTETYGAVNVNTIAFGAFVTASHYAGDLLSVVTSSRAIGLLEYSAMLAHGKVPRETIRFGFVDNSIWDYDPKIWEVDEPNEFSAAVSILSKTPRDILKREFSNVVSTERGDGTARPDYHDEMARVRYNALSRPDANLRETNRSIYTFVSSGVSLPLGNYVSVRSRITAGDYTEHNRATGLATRYAKHCSEIGTESASVAILIEQVCTYLPKEIPSDMIDKTWSELFKHFREHYITYLPYWKQIFSGLKKVIDPPELGINQIALRTLFPTLMSSLQERQINSFCRYGAIRQDLMCDIMVTLYMANHGHFRDSTGYRYAAKNGLFSMRTSWDTTYRRFSVKRGDPVRRCMSQVFLNLRNNASTALSGEALHRAFLEGLKRGVGLVFPGVNCDRIPTDFTIQESTTAYEKQRLTSWFGTYVREHQGLSAKSTKTFGEICEYILSDIKILAMARSQRGSVTVFRARVDDRPDAANWALIPENLFNFDMPIVIGDPLTSQDTLDNQPEYIQYAVKLYANRGILIARSYLNEVGAGLTPTKDRMVEMLNVDEDTYTDFKNEMAILEDEEAREGAGVQDIE